MCRCKTAPWIRPYNDGFVLWGVAYDATAFQSGDRLIGAQQPASSFSLTRYKANGTVDESFATGNFFVPGITTITGISLCSKSNDNIVIAAYGADSIGNTTTMGSKDAIGCQSTVAQKEVLALYGTCPTVTTKEKTAQLLRESNNSAALVYPNPQQVGQNLCCQVWLLNEYRCRS